SDSEAMIVETEVAERLLEAGHELLAGCVGFHRREAKQAHWDFFRTEEMSEEELIEDRAATLGGLSAPRCVGEIAKSWLWRYDFPPQETTIDVGDKTCDARTHTAVGDVVEIDPEAGFVVVKLGKAKQPATP